MAEQHPHSHSHSHSHGGHHHAAVSRIRLAFWFNLIFSFCELAGGVYSHSVAVIASAVHDLGDALAIGLALVLEKSSWKSSDETFSYGYRRLSNLSAMVTGVLMTVSALVIIGMGIYHLSTSEIPDSQSMLGFAALGVIVNGVSALRFLRATSLNEKMLRWHLVQDLTGWIMVFAVSVVLRYYPLAWLDPLVAIGVAVWVLFNVLKNLKEGLNIFLQAKPLGVESEAIDKLLRASSGVVDSHHTHLWSLDGESHILTTHLVLREELGWREQQNLKLEIKKSLLEKFRIKEATIEVERQGEICFDPDHDH